MAQDQAFQAMPRSFRADGQCVFPKVEGLLLKGSPKPFRRPYTACSCEPWAFQSFTVQGEPSQVLCRPVFRCFSSLEVARSLRACTLHIVIGHLRVSFEARPARELCFHFGRPISPSWAHWPKLRVVGPRLTQLVQRCVRSISPSFAPLVQG